MNPSANLIYFVLAEVGPVALAVLGAALTAIFWKKLERDHRAWAIFTSLSVLVVWAYMNSMARVAEAWKSPQYSHGYLIPAFAAILLFIRKQEFVKKVPRWQQYVGIGMVVAATLIRVYSSHMAIMTLDRVMLLPSLLGILIIVGGFASMRWAAAPVLFLLFMYPFPRALEQGLLKPLQTLNTWISHFALETMGIECFRQGNRIMLDGVEMGVVDACSGLRMLTIFVALAAAIAIISTNRPLWERIVIVSFSVPIALAVNSIRITLTGLAYSFFGNEGEVVRVINTFAHDFAGWIMMPMALGLLYLVYQLLANLIIEEEPERLSPIGL